MKIIFITLIITCGVYSQTHSNPGGNIPPKNIDTTSESSIEEPLTSMQKLYCTYQLGKLNSLEAKFIKENSKYKVDEFPQLLEKISLELDLMGLDTLSDQAKKPKCGCRDSKRTIKDMIAVYEVVEGKDFKCKKIELKNKEQESLEKILEKL
jgi:hypothetical protein